MWLVEALLYKLAELIRPLGSGQACPGLRKPLRGTNKQKQQKAPSRGIVEVLIKPPRRYHLINTLCWLAVLRFVIWLQCGGIFQLAVHNKSMYGKVKHTIRKHFEWATSWHKNQDHSMNVCKDEAKIETANGLRVTPPLIKKMSL